MEGFDCLGVEDKTKSSSFDVPTFLKTTVPQVVSAVEQGVKGGKPVTPATPPPQTQSWFARPVLGPIPGGGVLALGAAALAGLGYALKRVF